MKLNQEKINRLCIYFFFDKDGIVDRYVPYMLSDIRKNCSEVFVMCNGKLTAESRAILEKVSDHVMVRENKGFDAWAYKESLEYYGWEKLAEFDEVLLMNFTIYGPLYPFCKVFDEMNGKDLDFWGMTKHYFVPFNPFNPEMEFIPEHLQSYFICVRNKMLCSLEFKKYWKNLPPINNYNDVVGKHESIFTKTFNDFGFVSDSFVKTDDLEERCVYPLMLAPKELIENRKCPVFKKKMFTIDYSGTLNESSGEAAVEAYDYIKNNFEYDLNLVWENILRTSNMADIVNAMHLNYVLSRDTSINTSTKGTAQKSQKPDNRQKTALFMHLYFDDLLESSMRYANNMPLDSDIYFTVCNDKMYDLVKNAAKILEPRKVKIIRLENRGRDVSSLLVGCAPFIQNYDVACFAHDKKTTQVKPLSVGESFAYRCLENVLASREYCENIISRFEVEPRLGMMMSPPPNHADFFGGLNNGWGPNFENTKALAKELNINVDIVSEKEPISPLGTMFWFRPKALKPLFNKQWKYEDFPEEPNKIDGTVLHAIERVYGYAAQQEGFYCAYVMNDKYTAIELTNINYELGKLISAVRDVFRINGTLNGVTSYIRSNGIPKPPPPLRQQLKRAIQRRMPKWLWKCFRGVYHFFGGKKWLG